MDHGFMPIVVRVASQEDYDAWLNSQRARVSALTPQMTRPLGRTLTEQGSFGMSSTAIDTTHGHHGEHGHGFVAWVPRWITTTNHKEIGTLYLTFSLLMLFVGGGMAMVIRAELFQPGMQFVRPEFFNSMTTLHALIMVFAMIMPAFAGFANWMIPLMIGAPDMALPRLNNWSFWLLPFAVASACC